MVNNCDNKVWDIYEKGLTTTINQADSDFGKQTVTRYKPRSLAELSAWVAAIRPGFSSLLNNFLDRLPYTTGVKELDDLLIDSFHYLMYQESIMKYLVWLGIEEKGTYDIIKKIAKKKFKEEELDELKEKLLKGWVDKVGTKEGFKETWQVVMDAAHYSFNASHSLSVAIDSLYGAYLKSHYPLEYFTIVLSLYSDDMTRTANLISELKEFNINLNNIKFGKSRADYNMDRNSNSIYKSVSSIKYCNERISEELYALAQNNNYTNFIELLYDIKHATTVTSRQLEILIILNYFSDFGNNKYLLDIVKIFDKFSKCKIIKKAELEKLNLTEYLMKKYATKETKTQYREIDNIGLMKELVKRLENKSLSVKEQIKNEMEYLEYCIYTNPKVNEQFYIISEFKTYSQKDKPYVTLYNIKTGNSIKTKIKQVKVYRENPFGLYSILKIKELHMYPKSKIINGEWSKDENDLEPILESYEVIQ